MIKLETNNHSVFSLNYHLVIVTKYRRRVFDSEEMFVRLRGMAEYIGESHNVTISEMNGEPDHVHFLLKTKPNCDLSRYINALKSASSRVLKKEFPAVRRKLWKEYFWSQSYCLITVGGSPIDVLRKYIENQAGLGD